MLERKWATHIPNDQATFDEKIAFLIEAVKNLQQEVWDINEILKNKIPR
jgi:hypothetical protein